MMAIPHLLVGAAVGRATRRAWLARPVAFAPHFVLGAGERGSPGSSYRMAWECPEL